VLSGLREETPLFYEGELERWFVTRHADVRACLRERRLGRNFRHVGSENEFDAAEPLDPRRQAFWDTERWSLLWLEPPEHTRIRKLVAAAFTPRSVEALREPCAELAQELLPGERFELLRDFAQPYSIAVICRLLGVPTNRGRDLLDWSHAMVKMYELDTTEAQAETATAAAAEFRDYVVSLIEERRRGPRDDLVTRLVEARVDGERLSDAQIVSTIIVLLNAGHEATVNTLGNGVLALLHHRDQWQRLVAREVDPAAAVEELIRWDPPLQVRALGTRGGR
jgi:cytochrome P450